MKNNMGTKLHGRLNLSRIDKNLITTDKNGCKCIWVDILEKKEPDQYGNTHTVTLYNKDTRETIYLGGFKPQEFGSPAPAPQAPAQPEAQDADGDLPF